MVPGFAFVAVALSTLFGQAMLVRYTTTRRPHQLAWTIALGLFVLASAALVVGVTTGWDRGTFAVFFLLGAILSVPWLALGTVFLLLGRRAGARARNVLVFFSGLAVGVVAAGPMRAVSGTTIPVGKDVFRAGPRILAGVGSGVGATVILVGAVVSSIRFARRRGGARHALANGLIALGTLALSAGGLVQGIVGHDEAFTLALTVGIAVIYAGFLIADRSPASPDPSLDPSPDHHSS
jgi:hypothetical protein